MRQNIQNWNQKVVALYKTKLYSDLIHRHNLITSTKKKFIFLDKMGEKLWYTGYLAEKEENEELIKYFIPAQHIQRLPLRYQQGTTEEIYFNSGGNSQDVLLAPKPSTKPIAFRVEPKKTMEVREFFDNFAPFKHSNPHHWFLIKIIAVAGFVGRINACVCSKSEFGKSSSFSLLNALTDKSPVTKPRSIPGSIRLITETGNMVFDEVQSCQKDIKDIIEDISQIIGGGAVEYINGAMSSKGLKQVYNTTHQSITHLYNTLDQYDNPKSFFDNIFENNVAIDNKFLKVLLKGTLLEDFNVDFNMNEVAAENTMYYHSCVKMLYYLQDLWVTGAYQRRFNPCSSLVLNGRRKETYNVYTWLLDMYCKDQEEYQLQTMILDKAIQDYRDMVNPVSVDGRLVVKEERVQ